MKSIKPKPILKEEKKRQLSQEYEIIISNAKYSIQLPLEFADQPRKKFPHYVLKMTKVEMLEIQQKLFPFFQHFFMMTFKDIISILKTPKPGMKDNKKIDELIKFYTQKNTQYTTRKQWILDYLKRPYISRIKQAKKCVPGGQNISYTTLYRNMKQRRLQTIALNSNQKEHIIFGTQENRIQLLPYIAHIKFNNLKTLELTYTRLISIEPLSIMQLPELQFMVLNMQLVTSLKSLGKTNIPSLRMFSIKYKRVFTQLNDLTRMRFSDKNSVSFNMSFCKQQKEIQMNTNLKLVQIRSIFKSQLFPKGDTRIVQQFKIFGEKLEPQIRKVWFWSNSKIPLMSKMLSFINTRY